MTGRRRGSALAACALAALFAAPVHAEPAAVVTGLPESAPFASARAAVGEVDGPAETVADARRRGARARERVLRALRSEGFFGARAEVEVEDAEPPRAALRVTPGARFAFADWDVAFAAEPGAGARGAVVAALGAGSGAPARSIDVLAAEERAVQALRDAGFPDAQTLARTAVVDHARGAMDVTFRFDAGAPAVLGEIQSVGETALRPAFLRRVAPFDSGDAYAPAPLETFERRLRETGAFDGVDVRVGAPSGADPTRPVEVEVREGDRRTIALGVSYSSDEGAGLEAEWRRRNLLGGAELLTVSSRASELERIIDVELALPHWRRAWRTLRLGAAVENEETDAFDRIGFVARAAIEQPLTRRAVVMAELEGSVSELREDDQERETVARISAPAAVGWDQVDDVLDPTRGVRLRVGAAPTLRLEGGQLGYVGASLGGRGYQPLFGARVVAAGRLHVASIAGAELSDVPADDRLYAGGGGSVRGFEFQGIGPVDADGDPSGGLSAAEASGELRWRMRERFGLTAFVDGGAAAADRAPDLDALRWGAGLGVRYYAGFGPLRADIATPIDRRDGDPVVQVYLGIGQAF